jgi:putative ABC transport system permease protein
MLAWLWHLAGRLRALCRGRRLDRDFEQELESHLEMLTEANVRRGMTPEQAQRSARIELGGLAQLREAHREVRGIPWLPILAQDIRYGFRVLRNHSGFTAAALLALTLGIGSATAVFSLVNAVLLKPAPVPDPDSFVILTGATPAEFAYFRRQTGILQQVSAHRIQRMNYSGGNGGEQVQAVRVSADAFACWGTRILRGRTFTSREDSPGGYPVAVLGEGFWQRRFGGDGRVLGRTISLDEMPYTVIGIAASTPFLVEQDWAADVYLPFRLDPNSNDLTNRFRIAARLKPGVTLNQANAWLRVSAAAYRSQFPNRLGPRDSFEAVPYRDSEIRANRTTSELLMLLLGAVVLVLLIACANVAGLLLMRGVGRRREIALRMAIGAGRGRVIFQLLTESLLLSLAGSALGLPLGFAAMKALLAVNTAGLPRVGEDGALVGLDWRVAAFALAVSLFTGILFGLLPALEASRADLHSVLKDGGRSGAGLKQTRIRAVLVMSEVALAVVLLVGAALLIRTFAALDSVDPGFNAANVITMQMMLPGAKYQKAAAVAALVQEGLDRIRTLPGVAAACATYFRPLQMAISTTFTIAGKPAPWGPSAVRGPFVGYVPVAPGFFDVYQIPVRRGRGFTERDDGKSPRVVVINEAMAKQFWKDSDPLNDRIVLDPRLPGSGAPIARQIVGIVADIHDVELKRAPRSTIYLPQAQIPEQDNALLVRLLPMVWIARTRSAPHAFVPAIREQLRAVSGLPVSDILSMADAISISVSPERFNMLLMTVFASSALLLAAIGIYGLLAYSVEQRRQEIGIRLALGAGAKRVRNQIVAQGLSLTFGGLIVGAGAAWASSRSLASFLWGVAPRDPVVFTAVPVLLGAIALLSITIPAIRAGRIDPADALRYE